jgi:hypothetical protein
LRGRRTDFLLCSKCPKISKLGPFVEVLSHIILFYDPPICYLPELFIFYNCSSSDVEKND